MQRRTRPKRLPLAARITAVPVLVMMAGALTSGVTPSQAGIVKAPVPTSTELTVSPSLVLGNPEVKLEAKIKPASGTATPTGKVDLHVIMPSGSDIILDPSSGMPLLNGTANATAHLAETFVPDDYKFYVKYLPTGDFQESRSAEVSVTFKHAASTTTVVAEPAVTAPGKPVKLKAIVKSAVAGVGIPTPGSVKFTEGDKKLGFCDLNNLSTCEITTDKLALGKHTVRATVDARNGFGASSGTVDVRVVQESTIALTATPTTATAGAEVTLAAQVAGPDPKLETQFGGKVTFLDGATELGTGAVDKDGKASIKTTKLATGAHILTARFDGTDTLGLSTSKPVTVQINAAPVQAGQGGGQQSGGAQAKNAGLASTGASVALPIGVAAVLLGLGALALILGRRRRATGNREALFTGSSDTR